MFPMRPIIPIPIQRPQPAREDTGDDKQDGGMETWKIVLGLIVVVGLGVGVYFLVNYLLKSSSPSPSSGPSQTPPSSGSSQTPSSGSSPGPSQTPSSGSSPGSSQTPSPGSSSGPSQTPGPTQPPDAYSCYSVWTHPTCDPNKAEPTPADCATYPELKDNIKQKLYDLYPQLPTNYLSFPVMKIDPVLSTPYRIVENVHLWLTYVVDNVYKHDKIAITLQRDPDDCMYPTVLGVTFENGRFPNFGAGCWFDTNYMATFTNVLAQLFNDHYSPKRFVSVAAVMPVDANTVDVMLNILDDNGQPTQGKFTYTQQGNCSQVQIVGGHSPPPQTPAPTLPPAPPTDPPSVNLPASEGDLPSPLPANVTSLDYLYGSWLKVNDPNQIILTFGTDKIFTWGASQTGTYTQTELILSPFPTPWTITKVRPDLLALSWLTSPGKTHYMTFSRWVPPAPTTPAPTIPIVTAPPTATLPPSALSQLGDISVPKNGTFTGMPADWMPPSNISDASFLYGSWKTGVPGQTRMVFNRDGTVSGQYELAGATPTVFTNEYVYQPAFFEGKCPLTKLSENSVVFTENSTADKTKYFYLIVRD